MRRTPDWSTAVRPAARTSGGRFLERTCAELAVAALGCDARPGVVRRGRAAARERAGARARNRGRPVCLSEQGQSDIRPLRWTELRIGCRSGRRREHAPAATERIEHRRPCPDPGISRESWACAGGVACSPSPHGGSGERIGARQIPFGRHRRIARRPAMVAASAGCRRDRAVLRVRRGAAARFAAAIGHDGRVYGRSLPDRGAGDASRSALA